MRVDLWTRFEGLRSSQTIVVALVEAHNGDGTSTLVAPEGYQLRAIGQTVPVGSNAYVRDGRVIGPAASLPVIELTV